MTDVRFNDPPDCPDGDWCFMCLMVAKQRIIANHPDLAQFHEDGKTGVHWVPWDNKITLQTARFAALCDLPQLGLVPVCWTHVAGFQTRKPGPPLLQARGLVRGQG